MFINPNFEALEKKLFTKFEKEINTFIAGLPVDQESFTNEDLRAHFLSVGSLAEAAAGLTAGQLAELCQNAGLERVQTPSY